MRAIRCIPRARVMVVTASSPSGTAAMASEMPTSSMYRNGWPRNQPARTITRPSARTTPTSSATELGQLPLERRVPIARTLDERADLPDLAAHAGGGDDHPASPVGHRRAHEEHVPPVGDRRVLIRERVGGLGDRLGLAGQGGLFGLEPGAHDDAPVRGHPRSGGEDDDVARDEVGGGDLMLLAIADDLRHRRDLHPEGGEGLLRLPLGHEADERVQDDHGDDGGRFDVLVQSEGHRGRGHQKDHDEALELVAEDRKQRPRRLLGQRVGTMPLEAAGRLGVAQAALRLGVDAPAHLGSRQRVPRFRALGNGHARSRGHFTRSTGTGERSRTPSATLPSRSRARPPVPRAPTTSRSAREAAASWSSSASGTPFRTMPRARQPARFSSTAAPATSRRACLARSALRLVADAITARRTGAGNRARVRGSTGSRTRITLTRAPAGGLSRASRKPSARLALGEPSVARTSRLIRRRRPLTTSTGQPARRTTPRDTLPSISRRANPSPRDPTTITPTRRRRASSMIASIGGVFIAETVMSGQRWRTMRRARDISRSRAWSGAPEMPATQISAGHGPSGMPPRASTMCAARYPPTGPPRRKRAQHALGAIRPWP